MSKLIEKIRGLWSKDWVLKLISLCLAGLLWYFVGGEDVVEKNVMVPIEVISMPENLIISNKYKKEVEVSVRGPRSLIMEMDEKQNPRQIDLSDALPGTKVEPIENESIPVNRGIEVLRVQPSSIILSLDKLIQKEFPINPITIGDVNSGYIIERLRLDPAMISITGPQTVLSQVDVLKTTPINIQGFFQSAQLQIPLDLDPAIVDLMGETSVTADITIGFDTIEKTIANVPVKVVVDGLLQKVEPAKVTVILKIPKMIIKKKMNYRNLFTITAIAEEEDDRLKVQMIPSRELSVPLAIVSIVPGYVSLVKPPEAEVQDKQAVQKENLVEE